MDCIAVKILVKEERAERKIRRKREVKLELTADCSTPDELNQPLDLEGLSLKINTEGKE